MNLLSRFFMYRSILDRLSHCRMRVHRPALLVAAVLLPLACSSSPRLTTDSIKWVDPDN